jgi:hypothetical protein
MIILTTQNRVISLNGTRMMNGLIASISDIQRNQVFPSGEPMDFMAVLMMYSRVQSGTAGSCMEPQQSLKFLTGSRKSSLMIV